MLLDLPILHHRYRSGLRDIFATAALEALVFEAFCVGWFSLFRWVLEPTWPALFPISPDYNVVLFLLAFGMISLYVRHQYEIYCDVLKHCIDLLHTNPEKDLLTALTRELDGTQVGALDVYAGKKHLKVMVILEALHRCSERSLEQLTQATSYIWAFTVPWLLWGSYSWYGLIVLPIIALPMFCLRQYGVLFRHDHWSKTNPNWSALNWHITKVKNG